MRNSSELRKLLVTVSEYYCFHLPLSCEWENNEQSLVYSDIHTVTKVHSSPHLIGSVLVLETLQGRSTQCTTRK